MMRFAAWKRLRPYTRGVGVLAFLTVLNGLAQVGLAVLTRYVVDAALASGERLGLFCGLLVGILLLLAALYALIAWCAGSTADRCMAKLRGELLAAAEYSADARLRAYHSGQLLSRGMEDVHTVCDGAVSALPGLAGQLTRLVASFGAIFFLFPTAAGVLLAAAVAVGGITAALRPVIKTRHRQVRLAEEQVLAGMQENLQQLELLQALNAQPQSLRRFDRRLETGLKIKKQRRYWTVGSNSLLSLLSLTGTGVLLVWGAGQVAAGVMSYGGLMALFQLLSLFRGPVLGISGLWTKLAAVEVAGERLLEMLDAPKAEATAAVLPESVQAVVFEDVSFHYPNDETPVLERFSARFPMTGWVSLSGLSGKGKTTLFKLILGLYAPQQGRVYLETAQGEVLCGRQTRGLFAYVPQDYALFSGTVLENLLLAAPEADLAARKNALEIAEAAFVWTLTDGEQTQLQENNGGLSKGQLQRLAIARAVLMDRRIFLLDECTSALDHGTEDAVLRNLRKLPKNAIVVTHRPEALEGLENVTSLEIG